MPFTYNKLAKIPKYNVDFVGGDNNSCSLEDCVV
jgi:hypothetical protein